MEVNCQKNQLYLTTTLSTFLGSMSNIFPSTVIEWNNVDKSIRSSEILYSVRPSPNRTFNCHNSIGIKLITRFRLGLSYLQGHRCKHNSPDCLNPLKQLLITSFTVRLFQMKDQFFPTTFEASMKIF